MAIEFTIAATSKSSGLDAVGLNMEAAITQGKNVVSHMKSVPSAFGPIQGAIDTAVAVEGDIKSLSNSWGPFLQKVELFTQLVNGIAQVSGRADRSCDH
jgi:hypothetical protein